MGCCSTLIYLVSRVYFLVITLIFYVVNQFKTKQVVSGTSDDLLMISATEAVKRIARRELTSQALVRSYIHRIEQVNDVINAVVVRLFDEATRKAAEIDREIGEMDNERLEEHIRSKPLLGVPFTVKDALEVDEQIVTCGVYNDRNNRCTQTAEVIKRMEAAGAILIAITNVPEACYWLESSNGIYGLTRNPYDSRRIVGGSSGGEGALISAAGSVIGIGSDIGGSIRIPSFMNGIFGLKPTPGVVPLDGHVPMPKGFQIEMLRVGPMCRYAEDVPLLMEIMAGDRAVDLHLKDSVDFKKIRIFYMEGIHAPTIQSLSCEMRSTLLKAVSHFENKFDLEGIRLDLPLATKAIEMLFTSIQVEGVPTISESLISIKGDKGSLNWKAELPKLLTGKSVHTPGALFLAFFESMDRTSEEEKAEFRRLRDRLTRQVTETLGDDGILLFPSWPTTAPFHHQPVFTPFNTAYTGLFNALTLPVIECPMGLDSRGLPLGVQVVGARNSDRLLIAAAQQLSQAFGGWTPAWSQ
ncbi:hypothetical protein Y032_0050g1993 [Ancylostoma ceylanicum]|uniref:Amidase domain-containing protein n=4 Tax=Ancylostoma ceylanicum TaxID=53326 RepID=A0A016U8H9_9BILA|nr:hypothetical protein Y032_0050g1993 [Ancylostoma ceylanicum]EYC11594.1 hypothetical protein Y032_0050g1993 [Ancylostoma ceylanicum]